MIEIQEFSGNLAEAAAINTRVNDIKRVLANPDVFDITVDDDYSSEHLAVITDGMTYSNNLTTDEADLFLDGFSCALAVLNIAKHDTTPPDLEAALEAIRA